MYKYHHPKPIIIKLTDELGFELRKKAAEYMKENLTTTGAERGSGEEQGFGALAEIVIRNKFNMPEIKEEEHPLGYDILLPSKVKLDVKCRGGALPFQEEYLGSDNIQREAKHNLFARQIYDDKLDTDIYLMTHLETPDNRELPGTKRQRKWILYICGWVSKERAKREGVYLPRGSLTERGRSWFQYRGQEIEFYNKNLNGLENLKDLLEIDPQDVEEDKKRKGGLNLTSVDATRMVYDLVGHGILTEKHIEFIKNKLGIKEKIKPILSVNQYSHLLKWLKEEGQIDDSDLKKAKEFIEEEEYQGI
jgi:hypothetical protein